MKERPAETAENLAHGIEWDKAAHQQTQISIAPMTEIVADKDYHSTEVIVTRPLGAAIRVSLRSSRR